MKPLTVWCVIAPDGYCMDWTVSCTPEESQQRFTQGRNTWFGYKEKGYTCREFELVEKKVLEKGVRG